jgi:hypothetical protein
MQVLTSNKESTNKLAKKMASANAMAAVAAVADEPGPKKCVANLCCTFPTFYLERIRLFFYEAFLVCWSSSLLEF